MTFVNKKLIYVSFFSDEALYFYEMDSEKACIIILIYAIF